MSSSNNDGTATISRRQSMTKIKMNRRELSRRMQRSNTLPPGELERQLNQIDDTLFVAVRVRPLKPGDTTQWLPMKDSLVHRESGVAFEFARVFNQDTTNEVMHQEVGVPVVNQVLSGFNATVFAYGQTFSGKTHTIHGYGDEAGLVPLAVGDLFAKLEKATHRVFLMRASYVEIYNEEIFDLLASTAHQTRKKLELRELNKQFVCPGVTEQICTSRQDVINVLHRGSANRRVGVSNIHEQSSRSHSIFRIVLESSQRDDTGAPSGPVRVSQLNFVDLAGSELLVMESGAKQQREAKHINLSLTQLKSVITALSKREKHIPYRNSVLTKMLRDAVGGNSKTALVCCVYTADSQDRMTRSTLNFGSMAKTIVNKSKINEYYDDNEQTILLQQYQRKIVELEQKLADYDAIQNEKRKIQEEFKRLQEHVASLQEMERMHKQPPAGRPSAMRGNVVAWDDFLEMTRKGDEYVTPGGPDEVDDEKVPLVIGLSEDAMYQLANQLSMLTHENAMLEERLQRELAHAEERELKSNNNNHRNRRNDDDGDDDNNNSSSLTPSSSSSSGGRRPASAKQKQEAEVNRQKAIMVSSQVNWQKEFESVLQMPETDEDDRRTKGDRLRKVCDEYMTFQNLIDKHSHITPKKSGYHDRVNQYGQSMLWVAASNGQEKVVRFLLDARVNPDEIDKYGKSPLWIAVFNSQLESVRALLEPKATVNMADADGMTPLHVAAANTNTMNDLEIMKLLLNAKATLEARDVLQQTPLWVATANNNVSAMKLLLKHHANKEAKDIDGHTPLAVAAMRGYGDAMKLLLDAGALVIQARDEQMRTVLHLALRDGGQAETVKLLLDTDMAPVLLAAKDKRGQTALMTLCLPQPRDEKDRGNSGGGGGGGGGGEDEDGDDDDYTYNRRVMELLLNAGGVLRDLEPQWPRVFLSYRQFVVASDSPSCKECVARLQEKYLPEVLAAATAKGKTEQDAKTALRRSFYHPGEAIKKLEL